MFQMIIHENQNNLTQKLSAPGTEKIFYVWHISASKDRQTSPKLAASGHSYENTDIYMAYHR